MIKKSWHVVGLLVSFHAIYAIKGNVTVNFYDAQIDRSAIKQMLPDLFEIEDGLKNQFDTESTDLKKQSNDSFFDISDEMIDETSVVLRCDNKTIGFCAFGIDPENDDARIYMFAIDKNYRKYGHGQRFLSTIINHVHVENKVKTVSLCAHPITNSAGIKLYRKLGFEEIECPEKNNSYLVHFVKKLS